MMFILLILGALLVSVLSVGQSKATVVMCSSFSCAYNRRARCSRGKVAIYDNTVIGLCLFHSASMSKRILEPMGKTVERGNPNPQMINKIMQAQEDKKNSELIKNPKAFMLWMKKHVKN